MTTLIGVHGAGNYRAGHTPSTVADHLATVWKDRLVSGRLGESVAVVPMRVAYYAHLLRDAGRQGSEINVDDLSPEAESMVRSWLELVGVRTAIAQGPGTAPIRQALAWVARQRGLARPAVEAFVAVFFHEVARYLADPDPTPRLAARGEVAATIGAAGPPRIVVAHSLGTVVTYEALWAEPDLTVDLLVTLGSPLALPHAVFPRLSPAPADGRGRRPPGVRRWANIADVGDLVALPPRGLARSFDGVDADDEVVIHAFDFHLVANYLACAQLTEALRPYLVADPTAAA